MIQHHFFGEDVDMRKRLGTYDQLLRLHKELLTTIGGKLFLTKGELARRTGISEHTVKRRIEELREKVGADHLVYSHATHGYYYPENVTPPIECQFSKEEQNAIALLNEVVIAFRHTPHEAPLRNALKQIQDMVPDIPMSFTQDGPMYFCLPQTSLVDNDDIARHFKPILHAINEGRIIELTYYEQRDKQEHRYSAEPYHLFCGQGNWYLYANCPELKRRADFALQRIRGEIRVTSRTFPKKDPQEIIAKLRQRFGLIEGKLLEVAIRFSPARAEWIQERYWHQTQRFEAQPDGSVILHMQCEGIPSLTRWVLSFGGDAVPLAPPELVYDVRDKSARIIQNLAAQAKV